MQIIDIQQQNYASTNGSVPLFALWVENFVKNMSPWKIALAYYEKWNL